jgi:hypothetical protein
MAVMAACLLDTIMRASHHRGYQQPEGGIRA